MLAVRMGGQLYGLVPMGRGQGLNQTYGWGTESGDSFGSGTVSCAVAEARSDGARFLLACLLVFRAALRVLCPSECLNCVRTGQNLA